MIGCYDYSLYYGKSLKSAEDTVIAFFSRMGVVKRHRYLMNALGRVSRLGFDSVQIFCSSPSQMPLNYKNVKELCESLGLAISSVGSYTDISKYYKNKDFFNNFRGVVNYAAGLETDIVCAHLGSGTMPLEDTLRTLGIMADIAKSNGIKLALENSPFGMARRPEDMLFFAKNVKNLYINLDPANMLLAGGNPSEAVKALGRKIIQSHAKDAKISGSRYKFVRLGDGDVNLKEYFYELRKTGFRGHVIVEHEGSRAEESLAYGLKYMKNTIKWG